MSVTSVRKRQTSADDLDRRPKVDIQVKSASETNSDTSALDVASMILARDDVEAQGRIEIQSDSEDTGGGNSEPGSFTLDSAQGIGLIVGIAVGVGLCCLAGGVMIVCWMKRDKNAASASNNNNSTEMGTPMTAAAANANVPGLFVFYFNCFFFSVYHV